MLRIKRNQLVEIVLHILFWAAIFYTTGNSAKHFQVVRQVVNGKTEQIITIKTAYTQSFLTLCMLMLLFYSVALWLLKKAMKFNSSMVRVAAVLGWTAFIFMLDYALTLIFVSPASDILKMDAASTTTAILNFSDTSHDPVIFKRFGLFQVTHVITFLSMLGIAIAYFFSKEWIKSDLLRKQMEASQLSTEIKFLKSQINPHFLFNTLNNLFSMAQDKENDELADGISKLSGMMRYMIYESNAETVPLKNEVEYIKSCIALNKLRYADHEAIVDFRYSELAPDLFIAPMIFIPFVENAFKHGVTINNTSFIDIAIAVKDKELLFTCVNKNYSFIKKMVDDKSGIGLENVKRRLDLLYPGKHELLIKNDEEKFRVELKINLSE
ncbi:MAG: sensor histidine kinase [Mucilaginibacter sp.]